MNKKIFKRMITLLLTIIMLTAFMPQAVYAIAGGLYPDRYPEPVDIPDAYDPNAGQTTPDKPGEVITETPVNSAISKIKYKIANLSEAQKSDVKEIDLLLLYSEETIAEIASKTVSGGEISINQTGISELLSMAAAIKSAAEKTVSDSGIEIVREISADIKFKTSESKKITITIGHSAANMTADNIRVETPHYAVSIPKAAIAEGTKSGNLVITIEKVDPTAFKAFLSLDGKSAATQYIAAKKEEKYKVTVTSQTKENIKYSFEPASGDVNYQAVFRSDGTAVGGKYNPVTKKIDTRIRFSDTYTLKENKKDFTDITAKSKAMQDAIKVLASKGIINGTSATTFNPDGAITRAEIAALVVRTLSKLDENADAKFADVKKADWYCGAVGSAKSYGIINGMSATTFEPLTKIKKEQIIAIAARTLRSEMKWKTPSDKEKYLKKFTDRKDLPNWGIDDFALASMADLIVLRTDGKFNPTDTMTRGDAAIVLYRLFEKIW